MLLVHYASTICTTVCNIIIVVSALQGSGHSTQDLLHVQEGVNVTEVSLYQILFVIVWIAESANRWHEKAVH